MAGNYFEFKFEIDPVQPASEILMAELGYLGFESFVENDDGITAYIPEEEYEDDILTNVHILQSEDFKISYEQKEIERVNWNEEWEKNFTPILVDDRCSVRAPFHEKPDVDFDIVIEPKMSFGTGHHATTHMMIQHILKNDWEGKSVLDMGCGTGVLAILTAMKDARTIDAIDIDNWCYLNTLENISRNDCEHINVEEGGAELLKGREYDVILANINRNVIEKLVPKLHKSKSTILLSGLLNTDYETIAILCQQHHLQVKEKKIKGEWICLTVK